MAMMKLKKRKKVKIYDKHKKFHTSNSSIFYIGMEAFKVLYWRLDKWQMKLLKQQRNISKED